MLYVFHRILLYEHNLYSTDVETGGWVSRGFGSFKKYVTARGWIGGGGIGLFCDKSLRKFWGVGEVSSLFRYVTL